MKQTQIALLIVSVCHNYADSIWQIHRPKLHSTVQQEMSALKLAFSNISDHLVRVFEVFKLRLVDISYFSEAAPVDALPNNVLRVLNLIHSGVRTAGELLKVTSGEISKPTVYLMLQRCIEEGLIESPKTLSTGRPGPLLRQYVLTTHGVKVRNKANELATLLKSPNRSRELVLEPTAA